MLQLTTMPAYGGARALAANNPCGGNVVLQHCMSALSGPAELVCVCVCVRARAVLNLCYCTLCCALPGATAA
jgi:hypothetical protein